MGGWEGKVVGRQEDVPDFLFHYEGCLFVDAVGRVYAQWGVDGWEVDARHFLW